MLHICVNLFRASPAVLGITVFRHANALGSESSLEKPNSHEFNLSDIVSLHERERGLTALR